jgi:hypothetical protein
MFGIVFILDILQEKFMVLGVIGYFIPRIDIHSNFPLSN